MTTLAPTSAREEAAEPIGSPGPPGRLGLLGRVTDRPLALMLPALALLTFAMLIPIANGVNLSFRQTQFLDVGEFVGLAHYREFLGEPAGRRNIANSLMFMAGSLALSIPLGLGLALLLNRARGGALFRSVLMLPWVVSQLLAALLWRWMYSPLIGALAYVLSLVTGRQVDLLASETSAMAGLVVANVWRTFPFAMLLLLAALKGVSLDLQEAAQLDGASRWQNFRYVTFPAIRNTLLVVTIMLSIHNLNMVEIPFVMTGGGPVQATEVMGLRAFNEAFSQFNLGLGAAIAMVMFAMNVIASVVYIRVLKEDDA